MEGRRISLGPAEVSSLVKAIRIVFGVICMAVAAFWIIYSIKTTMNGWSVWVTVAFLTGFGLYQIWAGSGQASRYIVIGSDTIILRKNSLLPERKIAASQLSKIDIFPMNLVFHTGDRRRSILRFGTNYADSIEPVMTEVENFAQRNKIPVDIISEEL